MLARPLYALPQSTLGFRTLTACPIPDQVHADYHTSIRALLAAPPRPDGTPHTIRLSDPAYREWKKFQRHVEVELRDGGQFESIRDWASKLPGNIARVAALLHCALHANAHPEQYPIAIETMEATLALGGLFEHHALAVFAIMAVDESLDAAQRVWAWVARERCPTFSRRSCHHALQGSFPDLEHLEPALAVLVQRDYIFPLPLEKRPGRPSPRFRVNQHLTEGWS